MRKATVISVTSDRQLEIPPELQAQLNPGDEYIIWTTEDSITFKKIQKPLRFDELQQKLQDLGPDPNQLNLSEISNMIRNVRQQMAATQDNAE
ncbi:MAG: hypothetical protein EA342_02005 [Leptolyngbya sp. LCM1.Bin17]|nr:MAG: hypothetical protein EA342_02005 [Leptolyngbya sp. LCM1.Bin17]